MLWLAKFKILKNFFQKTHFFSKLPQKSNILRSLTISVAFYDKIATFSDFEDFPFVEKIRHLFEKKRTFWEILNFQSHSTANLQKSAQFFNLDTIFPKTYLCFAKPENLNVLRSLTNSVAFYGRFATISSL